jgi:hypothetical protein
MISSGMHENLMKKHVFFNLRMTKKCKYNVLHLFLNENRVNLTGIVPE